MREDDMTFAQKVRTPKQRVVPESQFLRDLRNKQYYARQEAKANEAERKQKVAVLNTAYQERRK